MPDLTTAFHVLSDLIQFESVLSSLRKTTKAWGLDIIPPNAGSAAPSRKGSVAPVYEDVELENRSQRHSRSNSQDSAAGSSRDVAPDVRKNSTVDLTDGSDSHMTKRRSSGHA